MSTVYASLIKDLRKKKGFSQQKISGKINISRQSYISLEQGNRKLSLSEAEKLADVFGVPVEIFSGKNVSKI